MSAAILVQGGDNQTNLTKIGQQQQQQQQEAPKGRKKTLLFPRQDQFSCHCQARKKTRMDIEQEDDVMQRTIMMMMMMVPFRFFYLLGAVLAPLNFPSTQREYSIRTLSKFPWALLLLLEDHSRCLNRNRTKHGWEQRFFHHAEPLWGHYND